jgi:hypothetical protein
VRCYKVYFFGPPRSHRRMDRELDPVTSTPKAAAAARREPIHLRGAIGLQSRAPQLGYTTAVH